MKRLIVSALALGPMLAFAQTSPNLSYVTNTLSRFQDIIRMLLPIVVGLALLGFFWGLAKFILQGGEDKEKGKTMMTWGVIALFVMVSVWGLVGFLGSITGVQSGGQANVPTVQGL